MSDFKRKQFMDNEVKPAIRKTIPAILLRLAMLENLFETPDGPPVYAGDPAETSHDQVTLTAEQNQQLIDDAFPDETEEVLTDPVPSEDETKVESDEETSEDTVGEFKNDSEADSGETSEPDTDSGSNTDSAE